MSKDKQQQQQQQQQQQEKADLEKADVWSQQNQHIQVAEGHGFLYNLKLRAKVDGCPSVVYQILTDPDSVNVFRSIKECTFRKVLEESASKKQRKLEVAHRAVTKFLWINVTFETRLHVWEDDQERRIRFCNAREGFMKKFEGSWHIQSFTPQTTAEIEPEKPSMFSALQARLGIRPLETSSALVTLEQAILPRGPMPPGMKGLVRRLCAKQINDMMEDLRAEVERRDGHVKEDLESKHKPPASRKVALAAPAASLTLSQPWGLWDFVTPISITIQL